MQQSGDPPWRCEPIKFTAVFATNFGYNYISSFRIDGNVISIAKDSACPKVPGDGNQ